MTLMITFDFLTRKLHLCNKLLLFTNTGELMLSEAGLSFCITERSNNLLVELKVKGFEFGVWISLVVW